MEFSTYTLTEVTVPEGYRKIYDNVVITVHDTNRAGIRPIENILSSTSLDDVFPVFTPPPDLTAEQFELYKDNATPGIFSGIQGSELASPSPIFAVGTDQLPEARIATPATVEQLTSPIRSVVFDITASPELSGAEIIDLFDIPTYPAPAQDVAEQVIYVVPATVIPYEGSKNNFVLTPIIDRVFPGLQLFVNQASFVESQAAQVKRVTMTFNVVATDVGFSFGISDVPPPETPPHPLNAPALFLDVGHVGKDTGGNDVDFSDPNMFQSSPKIEILVKKSLPNFPQLPNGCPDFKVFLLKGSNWVPIEKLDLTQEGAEDCEFSLEPDHFSKFAVGGVKGTQVVTDEPERRRGGSGGSNRTPDDVSDGSTTTSIGTRDFLKTIELDDGQKIELKFDNVVSPGQITVSDITSSDETSELFSSFESNQGTLTIENSSFTTTGKIYEIKSSSSLDFTGDVTVTIPYDEEMITDSSESDVRFLHHTETGWEDATISIDVDKNVVTGRIPSFSPVVAGMVDDGTYGPVYFEEHPLSRVKIVHVEWGISQDSGEDAVTVFGSIKNQQRISQDYTYIVQLVDQDGITADLKIYHGSLAEAESLQLTSSMSAMKDGPHEIKIFVIDNLDMPQILAEAVTENLNAPAM